MGYGKAWFGATVFASGVGVIVGGYDMERAFLSWKDL